MLLVLGASLSLLFLVEVFHSVSPGYEMFEERYRGKRLRNLGFALPGAVGAALIPAGLLGVRPLLSDRASRAAGLVLVGALVACASAAGSVLLAVVEALPRYSPPDPLQPTPPQVLGGLAALGWALGVALAGVGTLRARSLGRLRFAPLVLGPPGVTVEQLFVFFGYPLGPVRLIDVSLPEALAFQGPRALAGLGFCVFGIVLFGARERGRRATERENLVRARRLYAEAWGRGDVSVLDELLAPDFLDRRRGVRGVGPFAAAVRDLHVTFPDLEFRVERQRAAGERVVTRFRASGTDLGGLLFYPPTGRRATFRGVFEDRFRGGEGRRAPGEGGRGRAEAAARPRGEERRGY